MEYEDGILPVIPLKKNTMLPGMLQHFDINEKESIKVIETAMAGNQMILAVGLRESEQMPHTYELQKIGTICKIRQLARLRKGTIKVLLDGVRRAGWTELNRNTEEITEAAVCIFKSDEKSGEAELQEVMFPILDDTDEEFVPKSHRIAYMRILKDLLKQYCDADHVVEKELEEKLLGIQEPETFVERLAVHLPLDYRQRQSYLEVSGLTGRYELLCRLMQEEIEICMVKNRLEEKVKEQVEKNQRDYILREQMRVIQEELGESSPAADSETYLKKLQEIDPPEEIRKGLEKEISRFRALPSNAPESSILRTYLETALEMPWNQRSEDNRDLKAAGRILEADHYGLEKVKERIMEFLAVRVLTQAKGDSPILCLVGPPGVGKTSIAKSVARALNKEYVRISLGGIRDEAEIRGHRRTYIGALPGRIVNALRQAGTKNPVMLFDEIDKMGSDYKGDPASAMLEVLDSEQNSRFRDNYMELPIDLSEVLFIATANDANTIPKPLLDRMELIELNSYTVNEKVHIAKDHLWKKQLERHGLQPRQLTITEKALEKLIDGYTREAGVRNLERKIGQICRKAAREIAENGKKQIRVTERNLTDFLGKVIYLPDEQNRQDEIGVVTGLAWTSVGGDTLQIEVNVMEGRGEIQMTGKLGDVMKESASTALSYVRSIADDYGISASYFKKHDLHIHVPEGAVPKDGPSAGITMATAMLSAVAKKPVSADVAMTGEITLRGRVLPIGGLKEKMLAAKMTGMKTVIVPEANRRDVEEIDDEIKEGLSVVYAGTMETVIEKALVQK